jgi:putative glutamine amidotransferase
VTAPTGSPPGPRPVIGLSAYCETARWGGWQAAAVLLPERYSGQVQQAGGVPVLLPPVPGIEAAVARLDGLVLTGGGDIDPARYGAEPDPHTGRVSPQRDSAELGLAAAALAAGIPVLGICRGLQVLNVALGGTLRQHLPDDAGHRVPPGEFGSHPVRVSPGSRLAAILGGELCQEVPTSHHQAVDRLGQGLTATAWSADGVVEAAELADPARFVLAVQWHPEAGQDLRLMAALVAAAAGRGQPAPGQPLNSPP